MPDGVLLAGHFYVRRREDSGDNSENCCRSSQAKSGKRKLLDMTAPTSREELLALAARLVIASDILKRHPCEVVRLQQDCLAAAEALRAEPPVFEGDQRELLAEARPFVDRAKFSHIGTDVKITTWNRKCCDLLARIDAALSLSPETKRS
jgi:hypothetical protein